MLRVGWGGWLGAVDGRRPGVVVPAVGAGPVVRTGPAVVVDCGRVVEVAAGATDGDGFRAAGPDGLA
ncbi:MAG: hypothetical protein HOV83_15510 [Catenulispora sp.]|nr:hypothetical protein [Catenulispora sp.]